MVRHHCFWQQRAKAAQQNVAWQASITSSRLLERSFGELPFTVFPLSGKLHLQNCSCEMPGSSSRRTTSVLADVSSRTSLVERTSVTPQDIFWLRSNNHGQCITYVVVNEIALRNRMPGAAAAC